MAEKPKFGFANSTTQTVVADAGTPQDVASAEEINAANLSIAVERANQEIAANPERFQIRRPESFDATALDDGVTVDDVVRRRDELDAEVNQPPEEELPDIPEPSPFNDPEAYIRSTLFGDDEPTAAETAVEQAEANLLGTVEGATAEVGEARADAEERTRFSEQQKQLAETNNRIAQRKTRFRRELRAFEADAERRGVAREYFQDARAKLEADATAELADLYIIQQAQSGNVQNAQEYINTAVDNRYKSIGLELQRQQSILDRRIRNLDGEEKTEAQKLQIALNERSANLDNEREEARTRRELLISVANMGGDNGLQKRIMDAPTLDQSYQLATNYIGSQVRAEKAAAAAAAAGTGGFEVPTIKEINGVDYQWNSEIGVWEEVGVTGNQAQAEDAKRNIAFLRDVTARVMGTKYGDSDYSDDPLYKKASQTPVTKFLGEQFRGTSGEARLAAQVDTLRSQMLTLATDPTIKEFFGPQMSDADVRLMTAAGTTLRPGSQTPEELLSEAKRIDDLLGRMEAAAIGASSRGGNITTAPDGTLIEIVD